MKKEKPQGRAVKVTVKSKEEIVDNPMQSTIPQSRDYEFGYCRCVIEMVHCTLTHHSPIMSLNEKLPVPKSGKYK